ncbi:SpaH/EbpB family LPXTG-anchored major pilin [Microbacterium gorillae]|uniref:SpaH/EbpB family LPXTG-anchored major pilin n=1 Tax=Microbacterium gorillae TaxID=1231063 RepID=UPI003D956ECF
MSASISRRTGRVAATLLGIAALGATTMLGATAASAAPGNIDTTTPGSITIHKHLETGATTGANPNGTGTVAGAAIQGVEFTVYQLNYNGNPINLANFADWNGLSAVTLDANCNVTAPAGYTRGTVVTTGVTDVNGALLVNTNLDRKAYAVCETNTAGAMVGGVPTTIVQKASPFVISVPMPYNNEWIYNVHAYPKNSNAGIVKDIVSQPADQLGLGSTVTFPVTTDIPVLAAGDQLTSYVVRDVLDTRLTPVAVASVTVGGVAVDPSYYTVKVNPTNPQDIRVVFTATGLDWLETQGGKKVVTNFTGVVASLGTDGIIPNKATLFVNDPSGDSDNNPGPGVPSNEVTTNWGNLVIQKSDAGNSKLLSGATFQVFAADPAYVAAGQSCTSKVTTGSAISVNGVTDFTTDANGVVTVAGLFVSDSKNAPINATQRCYVIIETAAPAGYILPTGDAAKTAVAVTTGSATTVDIDVKNTKQSVPSLPLTGAAGQVLMLGGGAAVLVVGFLLIVARRRRQAAQL